MPRMTTAEFMNDRGTGRGGGFMKLSEVKKDIGCIHPDGGINSRNRHGMFAYDEEDDKGKKQMVYANFNCAGEGCPICYLRDWADRTIKDDPNLANEDVLSGGSGQKAKVFSLDELAGNVTGRDGWMQDVTAIKPGVVVAWVSIDHFNAEKPVSILDESQGMKIKIQDLLDDQVDDNGEEGDPIANPYPIAVSYKKDEIPAKKYNAYRATGTKTVIPDEVREVLETKLSEYKINVDKVIAPGDPKEMMKSLSKAWVSRDVDYDEFAKIVAKRRDAKEKREGKADGEPEERKGSGRGRRPQTGGDDETGKCPHCGGVVNGGAKFCGTCGKPLDEVDEIDEDEVDEKKDEGDGGEVTEKVDCPECGEIVKVNKRGRCPECAVLLNGSEGDGPPPVNDQDIPF